MLSHTIAIRIRQNMTADEAMSFALPDRTCCSPPKRSTVFSIALLSISTMINRNSGMININHSSSDCANPNDRINRTTDRAVSCLKADSYFQASRTPRIEFPVAAISLAKPVSPGFKLKALFLPSLCVRISLYTAHGFFLLIATVGWYR